MVDTAAMAIPPSAIARRNQASSRLPDSKSRDSRKATAQDAQSSAAIHVSPLFTLLDAANCSSGHAAVISTTTVTGGGWLVVAGERLVEQSITPARHRRHVLPRERAVLRLPSRKADFQGARNMASFDPIPGHQVPVEAAVRRRVDEIAIGDQMAGGGI